MPVILPGKDTEVSVLVIQSTGETAFRVDVADAIERLWIGHWKRLQQDGVNQSEDRGIRPNPQRNREDHGESEPRGPSELPHRIPDVLPELFQPENRAFLPVHLFCPFHIAVGTSRSKTCVVWAHASLPKIVLQQRQMRVDLPIQLCIQAAAAKQADALDKKTSEIPQGLDSSISSRSTSPAILRQRSVSLSSAFSPALVME